MASDSHVVIGKFGVGRCKSGISARPGRSQVRQAVGVDALSCTESIRAPGNASMIARTSGWSAAAARRAASAALPCSASVGSPGRSTARSSSACRWPRTAAPPASARDRVGASGCGAQLDHRRGEAHQVHGVHQMRMQHRLAVFRHQSRDVAETRRAAARPRGRAMARGLAIAGHAPPRGAPPAARRASRRCHRPGAAAAAAVPPASAAAPVRPATAGRRRGTGGSAPFRRRRVDRGRFPPRRRPSAASARRVPATGTRQSVGEGGAAGALGLRQFRAVAQSRESTSAGSPCAAVPAGPAARCRDRRRAHRHDR